MTAIEWDELFMSMVFLVAMKSKDDNTNIGAVIVDNDNRVVSVGYNGMPRGVDDTKKDRYKKPGKLLWFEHAERNSIYNAKRDLEGCRMYTNGIPCADCARAVIQSGIKEVIVHKKWNLENSERWKESCNAGKVMLNESGISIRYYDKSVVDILKPYRNGKVYQLENLCDMDWMQGYERIICGPDTCVYWLKDKNRCRWK